MKTLSRLILFICLFLAVVACAAIATAHAETPLPAAPASGWCYTTVTPPNYANVHACSVIVAPPVANRQLVADIGYSRSATNDYAHNVDVTKFENVFGRTSSNGPISPFPGVNFFAIVRNLGQQNCIALEFKPTSATAWGQFGHNQNSPAGMHSIDFSVSRTPCDFTSNSYWCHAYDVPGETLATRWVGALATVNGQHINGCPVEVGVTYYLNLRVSPAGAIPGATTVDLSSTHAHD